MMQLVDEAATAALGARLAAALERYNAGLVVSLAGPLGAGKTALARAILRALGHAGPVVSPSYTLIEPYALGARTLHHMDFYRLGDPQELEFLGVREIDTARDWLLVEWAERGSGFMPAPDIVIELRYAVTGRGAQIHAASEAGSRFLAVLENTT